MTASLENCRRLYEMSGWDTGENARWYFPSGGVWMNSKILNHDQPVCPAYDSDYLLEKLPNYLEYWFGGNESGYLHLIHYSKHWSAGYEDEHDEGQSFIQHLADTPADALCLLAIRLFEDGILLKGGE